MKEEASVVIRCKDDMRVFECIESIDYNVEIVVVMNDNQELEGKLHDIGVTCRISPSGNLSVVSNIGFSQSTSDKIIITDSDTLFGKDCIHAFISGLDEYEVVRAPLRFASTQKTFSKTIAESRDYVNSLPVVYTPGIAVTRRLPEMIGGYLFDNAVPFGVDANLNYRIQREHIPVRYLSDVWVSHAAETLHHDLKAARRIGAGCRESSKRLAELYPDTSRKQIGKSLKGVKLSQYPDLFRKKGLRILAYQTLWDLGYYYGYYLE